MKTARATAHSNIALVKYWGKREGAPDLNLPAVGSLSMTLDGLRTETIVGPAQGADAFTLNGEPMADAVARKTATHLDRVWTQSQRGGSRPACRVDSINHLPTAAGLASSASGFAALTLAAAAAFELELDYVRLSALARRGSGSAARSLWGGFVRLDRGRNDDGSDCLARPIAPADHWDVRLVVVETTRGPKSVGSTEGMERSRLTSPYYAPWIDTSEADLSAAQDALLARDLPRLGEIVEHSCFKMHACMMATRPPILYFMPTTLGVVREVWNARQDDLFGFVTMDAGPHVKVLTSAAQAETLRERLAAVPGVQRTSICAPGPDASVQLL